jgi:enoyl-CoA hydratase/carnithine racemase
MTDSPVLASRDNGVLTITLNRPDALNALLPEMHQQLHELFDEFSRDDDLHIAVLTGAGDRAFCAGSDLVQKAPLQSKLMPDSGYGGLLQRFDLTKPVIAAINGHAIGGGMEIVLACDLAVAVSDAKFGLPEPKVGLAASGGLHRLVRQLPLKHAMHIALTGELFSAATALQLGLVNSVVEREHFQTEVDALVSSLKASAPLAMRATKEQMMKGIDAGGLRQAHDTNYPLYDALKQTEDAIEGMNAFAEKRKPVWRGR